MVLAQTRHELAAMQQNSGARVDEIYLAVIRDCDSALNLNPTFAAILSLRAKAKHNLGVAEYRRGHDPMKFFQGALEDYTTIIDNDPTPDFYYKRSNVRWNMIKYRKSIRIRS